MTYDVEILEETPRLVAATTMHTNLQRIGDDIGRGFEILMRTLGKEGVSPAGPPLVVYHQMISDAASGDVEICVPVDRAFSGESEVHERILEGGTMATTVHRGPYQDISTAHETLTRWIAEHGHHIAGPPREIYLNDPQTVPPDQLLTRVDFPISSETT